MEMFFRPSHLSDETSLQSCHSNMGRRSKIVKGLLAEAKSTGEEKPRSRKRSNDRCRTSKHLSEEAEKYIQDFVSNVEDTEISSLDGEKSDTSSSIGGLLKLDNVQTTADSQPRVEMDCLHWETCNDVSTPSCEEQSMWSPPTWKFNSLSAAKDSKEVRDRSCLSPSSLGSCTPGTSATGRYTGSLSVEAGKSIRLLFSRQFNMDEY